MRKQLKELLVNSSFLKYGSFKNGPHGFVYYNESCVVLFR